MAWPLLPLVPIGARARPAVLLRVLLLVGVLQAHVPMSETLNARLVSRSLSVPRACLVLQLAA